MRSDYLIDMEFPFRVMENILKLDSSDDFSTL